MTGHALLTLDEHAYIQAVETGAGVSWVEKARALRMARDSKLYRELGYKRFDDYCKKHWGMGRRRAHQLIRAVDVYDNIHSINPPISPVAEQPPQDSLSVYFIQCGNTVKIGVAVNAEKRRASLQIGNPTPLTLLAAIPGDKKTERELHKRFAADRVSGEWFALSPELRQYIGGLK